MYEPLEPYAKDFNEIRTLLNAPDSQDRVNALRAALDATAEKIGATPSTNELDRSNLAKLYRGFLATSRALAKLQEQRANAS
ncbi:type III secretion protein [Burkholderia gladioli]|uniref:type III secretion protein n=1 Tax=Burkholderia gladioli TaxID=28095 RepID=UPI00163F8EB4|nr:type III secretion protein [Burkholderia gladioli]